MNQDVKEIIYELTNIIEAISDKDTPEDVLGRLESYVFTKFREFDAPAGDCT